MVMSPAVYLDGRTVPPAPIGNWRTDHTDPAVADYWTATQ